VTFKYVGFGLDTGFIVDLSLTTLRIKIRQWHYRQFTDTLYIALSSLHAACSSLNIEMCVWYLEFPVMHKVQKTSNSQCYIPSSKTFRSYLLPR
jgi:hypothetical protein